MHSETYLSLIFKKTSFPSS